MSDRLRVLGQYFLPKQALTKLAGKGARSHAGEITSKSIEWFIQRYQVNMSEALNEDPKSYATFNDFFTRALKPGMRPIASEDVICPVDGAISQAAPISDNRIIQAKGIDYSLERLLANKTDMVETFRNGHFATIYLSPKDYHRIHMPCNGTLLRMIYVPGDLFSVNPLTARGVPNLFARNERVICEFEGDQGRFVMVLVGATIVGSMATVWHGTINEKRPERICEWTYAPNQHVFQKGDEMGRFMLGSTVVLLYPKNTLSWPATWVTGQSVRLGQGVANWIQTA